MAAFDPLRSRVLRWMRVPPEPMPPAGAPGSVRVFRAGRNFYKLKLLGWGVGQLGALVGIIFSLAFIEQVESEVERHRETQRARTLTEARERAAAKASAESAAAPAESPAAGAENAGTTMPVAKQSAPADEPAAKAKGKRRGKQRSNDGLGRIIDRSPWWFLPMIQMLEYVGILGYLLQIPITYAMVRLDWEQRWYIVTDRSLRIRTGLATVTESTMSFANLQQVVVTQGPLQRMLGLADVMVQSAGGRGPAEHHHQRAGESLHVGYFHGVGNAPEIRDLILERLRLFRQAGLGDPDDPNAAGPTPTAAPGSTGNATAAAEELLSEARALRSALARP